MTQQIQRAQQGNGQIQKPKDPTMVLSEFLTIRRPHLEAALPKSKGLTVDRLIKLAMLASNRQPKLLECDLATVFQALMQCAELGLEPSGTLGHAYLVPYKVKGVMTCTLVIGYRGLIDLARRSGALKQIEAHVVHERDVFKLRFGLEPLLEHEPCLDGNPGKPKLVYCVVQLADGAKHVEVMTWAEVMKIKARSKSADYGPWVTDEEEMAKKTVSRRTCKWVPMSSELAVAIAHEDEGADQHGGAGLTVVGESATPAGAGKQAAKALEAVRVQQAALAPRTPTIVDVAPNESEEAALARHHAELEAQLTPPEPAAEGGAA
jgi:recombination protein RecT